MGRLTRSRITVVSPFAIKRSASGATSNVLATQVRNSSAAAKVNRIMNSPNDTPAPYAIAVLILLVVVYDIYAIHHYGYHASISAWLSWAGRKWPFVKPLVAFAMGMLYWHWFIEN